MKQIMRIWKKGFIILFALFLFWDSAAVLAANSNQPYQVIFEGDWGRLKDSAMHAKLNQVFNEVYPRLCARWGRNNGKGQTVVRAVAVEKAMAGGEVVSGYASYVDRNNMYITFSTSVANRNHLYLSTWVHELVHVVECYRNFSSEWWTENLAEYGAFRYLAWTEAEYMNQSDSSEGSYLSLNFLEDAQWLDWGYEPYGKCELFFAYMDARYPTTKDAAGQIVYGLIDSINRGIQDGSIISDGGKNHTDAGFNAVVKKITGFDNIELLRQQYVQELLQGTWSFNGFGNYVDNYITENLPGTKNPSYPVSDFSGNLCFGAVIDRCSGEIPTLGSADFLVDSNLATKWSANSNDADRSDSFLLDDTQHYIVINLGGERTFNSYVLYHTGIWGDNEHNTVSWRVRYLDKKQNQWIVIDECKDNKEGITVRVFSPVKGQYILLELLNSDQGGSGAVNLHEMLVYNTEISSANEL